MVVDVTESANLGTPVIYLWQAFCKSLLKKTFITARWQGFLCRRVTHYSAPFRPTRCFAYQDRWPKIIFHIFE